MKSLISLLFITALVSISGCKKDNKSNLSITTNIQYMEITIDGKTHKYRVVNSVGDKDENGEQGSTITWNDSTISFSCANSQGGMSLNFPLAVNGLGSFVIPQASANSGNTQRQFEGSYSDFTNSIFYFANNKTRSLSGTFCELVSNTISQQTLTISTWGPLGILNSVENCSGSFSGTLYDQGDNSSTNCVSSTAHVYSGKFNYSTN